MTGTAVILAAPTITSEGTRQPRGQAVEVVAQQDPSLVIKQSAVIKQMGVTGADVGLLDHREVRDRGPRPIAWPA
jgi:hypothetical protein